MAAINHPHLQHRRRREHLDPREHLEHPAQRERLEQPGRLVRLEQRERLRQRQHQHQKNRRCGTSGYIFAKRIYPDVYRRVDWIKIKTPCICAVNQSISLTDESKEEVPVQTLVTRCIHSPTRKR
ncbi:MAG: hypothetical protein ABSC19_18695 [Syntrophorhabdales bacterium]